MSGRVVPVQSRPRMSETFRPIRPFDVHRVVPVRSRVVPGIAQNPRSSGPQGTPLGGPGPLRGLTKINTLNGTGQLTADKTGQTGFRQRATSPQSRSAVSPRPATLTDTSQAVSVALRGAQ